MSNKQDVEKISKIVRDILSGLKTKNPKDEIKELEKAHDAIIDAIVKFNKINFTLSSNLSKEQHSVLHKHIDKLKADAESIKEFISGLKFE